MNTIVCARELSKYIEKEYLRKFRSRSFRI